MGFDRNAIVSSGSVAFLQLDLRPQRPGTGFAEAWAANLDTFHTRRCNGRRGVLPRQHRRQHDHARDDAGATLSVTDDSVIGRRDPLRDDGGQVTSRTRSLDVTGSVVILIGAQAPPITSTAMALTLLQLGSGTRVISDATLLATTTQPNVSFGAAITQDWGGLPFIATALPADSQAAWLNAL
jgi:hypothetical protein